MSVDVRNLTLAEASGLIRDRKLSPVEVTRAYLDRIERYDHAVNSFITVTAEAALQRAQQAEREIAAGRYRGPMHGVPYALKDIVETKGILTTAHSRVLRDYVPTQDAVVEQKLAAGGGVLLGKLACLEFAHASPSPDQAWPQARNPWNTDHGFTGGSSTGSASAVAASLTPCAIGTDTGGSVRNPAALCGITGLMPTYGRVSRRGVIPYSFSLDHVGPMAWTARDCAIMLQAIAGYDEGDPGSLQAEPPDFVSGLDGDIRGMRIGLLRHMYEEDMTADEEILAAMRETVSRLEALGASVSEVRARPLMDYHDCKLVIGVAEFYAVHEAEFARRFHDYGADLQTKTFQGAFLSAADYLQAQRVRRHLADDMQKTIAPFDALLVASNFRPAPRIQPKTRSSTEFFQKPNITAVFNVTGNPAIAIPNGFSASGLPLSCMIVGKRFDEARILKIADALERQTPWVTMRPKLRETSAA
jgi:aspartyl-tRNA(Asn)/glutamyl-tRNA(Gln) amidotransferase subunit A